MASGSDVAGQQAGALIVGASSGMGAALARLLVADGYRVALVARRKDQLDTLCGQLNAAASGQVAAAYAHDVRAYDESAELFARIAADVSPLRLMVYAAGIMPPCATGTAFSEEQAMVETNTLGAMRWLGLAADYLERQGGGTLVGISSVAGDRGRPGNGGYMASKAALSTYLDSLRYRLKGRGVRVVTVKAGYVDTPMTEGLQLPRLLTVPADKAARRILRATSAGHSTTYVPGYWAPIMWVVRRLPSVFVARLPG